MLLTAFLSIRTDDRQQFAARRGSTAEHAPNGLLQDPGEPAVARGLPPTDDATDMPGDRVIEVQHITKRTPGSRPWNAFPRELGDILGFLVPNGAGKTTTMRILTGYMPPIERGCAVPASTFSTSRSTPSAAPGICRNAALSEMTVREYLDFVSASRACRARTEAPRRLGDAATHIADMAGATAASCRRATGSASASRSR